MTKLPKTCLTCKFMEFVDDELEVLHCFETFICNGNTTGIVTSDGNLCDRYELNKLVEDDAKAGCW